MAKPTEGKENNNPNKPPMELNQNVMMILNNVILIIER